MHTICVNDSAPLTETSKEYSLTKGEHTAPKLDIISLKMNSNSTYFVHTNAESYTINKNMNLVVEAYPCTVDLVPNYGMKGTTIIIVNSCAGPITINTVQLMFNNMFLSPLGGDTLKLYPNNTLRLTYLANITADITWWSIQIV